MANSIYVDPEPNVPLEYGNFRVGDSIQHVNIVDTICEGPVRGLIDGSAGIFLNDVSIEHRELRQFTPSAQLALEGTITFPDPAVWNATDNTTNEYNLLSL